MTKRILLLVAVIVLATAVPGCGQAAETGSVTVLGPWTGTEEKHFQQVLDKFTDQTGIEVSYQGTRAVDQVLLAEVRKGTPPDVAVLFSMNEIAQYVRGHDLRPLDDIVGVDHESGYSPQWRKLEQAGFSGTYAVVVKANLKSLIWYNPARFRSRPQTWDQLIDASGAVTGNGALWCLGMGSPPTSGWPGTDWIEDILLHQAGLDAYQQWAAGTLPWTSRQVREAWTTWGTIAADPRAIYGGSAAALLTDFSDAGRPLFTDPPGCLLDHDASFIIDSYRNYEKPDGTKPAPGADFDFFPFPTFDNRDGSASPAQPWVVSADMAGLFNDTPQAKDLIRFLVSPTAQEIWPRIEGSGAFSPNKQVGREVYSDSVSRRIGDILTSSTTLCADASDLMPAPMRNTFYRAVLEYVANPGSLDSLLEQLDKVRAELDPEEWLTVACGQ